MNPMEEWTLKRAERQEVAAAAKSFALLLINPDLTDEEIDTAIEALRPLRMQLRAIDYGEASGYRKPTQVECGNRLRESRRITTQWTSTRFA
jgi:hypothetical protein